MPKFKIDAPQASDATIARVRAAAHHYVRAGGSIFPNAQDTSRADHVGNVVHELKTDTGDAQVSELLHELIPDFATHERMYDAIWAAIGHHEDAAFLFGCFVGLETAALTFCHLTASPTIATAKTEKAAR